MATETDVYEIEADGAKRSLTDLAVLAAGLAVTMRGLVEIGKDSIRAAADEEKANLRLANALKTAGYEGGGMLTRLDQMAEGFEKATNVSSETVKSIQELMVQFGVAPKRIEGLTQAVLDYAAATGKDGVAAARELIGAIRGESDAVGKLKLDLTGMTGEAQRADAVISEIGKTMGGAAATGTQGFSGQLATLQTNLGDAEKAFGRLLLAFEQGTGVVGKLAFALKEYVWLGSEERKHDAQRVERQEILNELADKRLEKEKAIKAEQATGDADAGRLARLHREIEAIDNTIGLYRDMQKQAGVTEPDGSPSRGEFIGLEKALADAKKKRDEAAAKDKQARDAMLREIEAATARWDARMEQMGIETVSRERDVLRERISIAEAGLKERNAKIEESAREEADIEQRRIERIKKVSARDGRSPEELALALAQRQAILVAQAQREAAEMAGLQDRIAQATNADLKSSLADQLDSRKKAAKQTLDIIAKLTEDIEDLNAQAARDAQKRAMEILQVLGDAGMQLASAQLSQWAESLTQNAAYTAAYREKSIERRELELAELGVIQSRADIEAEMAAESAAANDKRLASTLASIGTQAAINAVLNAAQAIAAAATYQYATAAQHGAAAAAFAGVAAAAGVAAYGVAQGRGMTGDEKQSLAAFDKRKDEAAKKREKKQGGEIGAGEGGGTQVNVYNFGITGQTRTAQGRELEKLRQEYGRGSVSGGGF